MPLVLSTQSHRNIQSSVMTLYGLTFQSLFLLLGWILEVFSWMFTFLYISKISPNTKMRDQNLSPSKVVTLYSVRYLWLVVLWLSIVMVWKWILTKILPLIFRGYLSVIPVRDWALMNPWHTLTFWIWIQRPYELTDNDFISLKSHFWYTKKKIQNLVFHYSNGSDT